MDARLLRILNNREQNYPHALEKQYPRIFSQIMALWGTPEIEKLFSELLVTQRLDRQGFPEDVASDLIYLSMVHARLSGSRQIDDPWSHVVEDFRHEIELKGYSFTPQGLISAVESGNLEVVRMFLTSGADVDTLDDKLWTPLLVACSGGEEKIVKLLIKNGANVHHEDGAGFSSLHWAAFNGYSKILKLLLVRRADVNSRSKQGWTPLMQAATRGHLSACFELIEHGADVNASSKDGWTSLHKASANGHLPVVKLLLSKGANAMSVYNDGITAVELAKRNNHENIADILLAANSLNETASRIR